MALHDKCSGIDGRQVVSARSRRRPDFRVGNRRITRSGKLAYRHRLAGEQRFVHLQSGSCDQPRIGRNPVAFV